MTIQIEQTAKNLLGVNAGVLIERTLQDLLMYADQTNITQVSSFEIDLDGAAKELQSPAKVIGEAMFVTSGTRVNGDSMEFFENEPVRFDFQLEDDKGVLRLSNITASCFDYRCVFPSVEIPCQVH